MPVTGATQFVMASFVPKLSYQTYLDCYTLLSIFMLGAVIVENFAVATCVWDMRPCSLPTI